MTINLKELPVEVGLVHEGERIRGPDTFLELGGPKVEYKAELVQLADGKSIKDEGFELVGKDIPDFSEGDKAPFGILVEVYGKKIEKDIESVIERRIHDFINYIQGMMHLNQRYDIWCRISKEARDKGLKFEHIAKAMMALFKTEFPFIEKIQVTLMTDEAAVKKHHAMAMKVYEARDARIRGMKDSDVDEFYGCTLCQSFAPTHLCIISPERVSLCGAISWIDARAAARVDPEGPNFVVKKGELLNEKAGEYSGVNDAVGEYSNGTIGRFNMYSMFGPIHTSCGCFEAIGFYIPEVDGIGVVDRNFAGPAVNGIKFSSMATQAGGGAQVEGFLGFGIQWMYSDKFFSGDGGLGRIVWMPSHLKERMKGAIPKDLLDKIPTEKDVESVGDLRSFLDGKKHPVVGRWAKEKKTEDLNANEGGLETAQPILVPEMGIPAAGGGVRIILKNARIYADKVIIRKNTLP